MKKLIYSMAALATMLFASCQQEELPEPVPQENTVTYTVEVPGVQTKAIGDGTNINQLVYEVWKTEEDNERALKDATKATRLYQKTVPMAPIDGKIKTVISLNLVQDQSYTILFWAQCVPDGKQSEQGASEYYNTDNLTAVTYKNLDAGVPANYLSNNESMAAFYKTVFLTKAETDTPNSRSVELRRPFAQLNIATKNTSDEYKIKMNKSNVTISDVPTVFDVAWNQLPTTELPNGVSGVSESKSFEFRSNEVPKDPSIITVNGQQYEYVAMNYIFASGNVTVEYNVDVTLTSRNLDGTDGATTNANISNKVVQVPLKENYRTNIVGNLLTHTTDYEVIVDAGWDDIYDEDLNGDGIVVEVWDQKYIQEPPKNANGEYEISLASELAWLSAAVNGKLPATKAETLPAKTFEGKKFVLMEDIDLLGDKGARWIPIGASGKPFMGTFDGKGKTISNLTVATEGTASAGLFGATRSATIKNVTVVNANITGHYKTGVIVGDGLCAKIENCHVDGATVIVTPFEKDDANNVGGIVGYLAADGGAAYAKDCSVKDATITAYRKVGGLVGAANGPAEVSGKTLGTVKVTADMTSEYKSVETAYAGPYVGYKHDKATVTILDDSVTPEVKVLMDSAAELNAGSGNAEEIAHVFISEGEIDFEADQDVKVNGAIQTNPGETVVLNVNGNTIETGTANDYGFIAMDRSSLELNDANITSNGGAIAAINGATVTVDGGSVAVVANTTNPRYNIYAEGDGSKVIIKDGTFSISKLTLKRAYVYASAGTTVEIHGGTFGKASSQKNYKEGIRVAEGGTVIITGGTFGFDPTKWVAAGYTAQKDEATKTWTVVSLTNDNLKDAVAVAGATVKVAAGEYAFPKTIAEGVNIVCEPGTVFTGSANLNIKTASVEGATFKNENGSVVNSGSISGTYKNCVFEGKNVFRYGYAGESLVFEDCTFRETADEWVFHFDGASTGVTNASIICRRCTFDGDRVAIGGSVKSLVMEDCDFINGSYFNSYCNSEYTGCDFNTSVRPLDAHHKYTDCTIKGSALSVSNLTFFKGYDCTLNIDGVAYTYADGLVKNAEGAVVVWRRDILETALNAAKSDMTIVLHNDIYGNVTVSQKEGVNLVIDGAKKKYDGTIYIHGNARHEGAETLTIQNVNFVADAARDFISSDETGSVERYAHNVTVKNCTFSGHAEAVGFRLRQAYDITVQDCVADGIHSLAQNTSTQNQTYERCTVNAGRGINLLTSSVNTKVVDCQITATKEDGYGIRVDAAADNQMEVTRSTINAYEPIVLRSAKASYTLKVDESTLNASGSEEIVVKGETPSIIVDGKALKSASNQNDLNSAVAGGSEVEVSLGDGTYTLPSVSGGDVTISGSEDVVITVTTPNLTGSDLTLNGVTVKGSGYSTGVQHVNTVTYNDVKVVGEMCLYGEKVVFNECTFELASNQYIWTYGAKEVEFIGCTFNTAGKAILVYNEGAGASKVTVKGCTFNATAGATAGAIANQNCAAIEIDNYQKSGVGAAHVVITENNTNISENFSGEWRIKNFVAGNPVTVNGVQYTQIALDGSLMTIDASKNVTVL